jgi:hypothetical protein
MVQLYRDARRDGRASWARLASDVVVSAPVQYKEALRTMSTSSKLIAAAITTTVAIVVFAVIGGAFVALLLVLALAWILSSLRMERGTRAPQGSWWKIAGSGAGVFLLALLFFGGPWPASWREAVPGDVAWSVGFLVFVGSLVLVVVGLLLGITERFARRRLSP